MKKCVPYLLTVLVGVADLNRFSLSLMLMKRTMFLFFCSSVPQSPTRRRQLCGVVRLLWRLIDAVFFFFRSVLQLTLEQSKVRPVEMDLDVKVFGRRSSFLLSGWWRRPIYIGVAAGLKFREV